MLNILAEFFYYAFIVRAIIVGVLVSVCSALLGVPLVLKRYSMIGDGLSHVGFGALAVASALNAAPLKVAIPLVVFAAFLLLRLNNSSKVKGDTAIAVISTSSLALGVIILSVTKGMNTDVYNYMFGSILSMSNEDVILSIILKRVYKYQNRIELRPENPMYDVLNYEGAELEQIQILGKAVAFQSYIR